MRVGRVGMTHVQVSWEVLHGIDWKDRVEE